MEQMMGVKEGIPAELSNRLTPPSWRERAGDALAMARTAMALVRAHRTLSSSIAEFRARLDDSLASAPDLSRLRPDELVSHYRELERTLLTRWDAPLVNDFLAMIFFGVLGKLATSWCGDAHGTLQNDLVSGGGDVISAEPAKRIVRMAGMAQGNVALVAALSDGDAAAVRSALAAHPELQGEYDDYIAVFGDRCLEELKLETLTLGDDPMLLARSIGRLARARGAAAASGAMARSSAPIDFRGDAERAALQQVGRHPLRRIVFRWVLRHARLRVRDRENLRFERTRVFGRVRRIFVELGRRYEALGVLDRSRDVFYLTVDEALGWAGGLTPSADLRGIAAARASEFARYHAAPAPPDRFQTRGPVHVGHGVTAVSASVPDESPLSGSVGDSRRGLGCYPGVVRGVVRVVRDPRGVSLEPGEILVAERTDPGWVMLFPAASGLLVERGSLLSHSAIVARELALPAIVSIAGLTSWLETGDVVELDGRTGVVVRAARRRDA
jgi:pyruvate,water dikinase